MKKSIFVRENQMEEWVEAAERIKHEFGISKALGYLIGEKFHDVIEMLYTSRRRVKIMEEQRNSTSCDPLMKETGGNSNDIGLDDEYEKEIVRNRETSDTLIEFSSLIKNSFSQYEIKEYLNSHPRLGILGHVCTEEEHEILVAHDAVEHSIDMEVKDAMIFGDMMKYLVDC